MNWQLIIEVLSNSTKTYDRSGKFKFYQTIPILQEYIMINRSQVYVEQYCKLANKLRSYPQYDEEDAALVFNLFQVEVLLVDINRKVDFAAENEPGNEIEENKEE
ncbi:Uma2 family endonuclease [Tychonema sp. LEGE 07203]|uniref:Uma2 family endonuclease n=1 Tax=Tychonema sp. LEGE 07203 TaxID=1828671 RepID=UPI0018828786|nr:Uma2 family endonuclease [Tychonema sp. LEGE 07203]MBE9093017.1 Uma2 family endonuclease [Tychonema sp. LEGE 07203]